MFIFLIAQIFLSKNSLFFQKKCFNYNNLQPLFKTTQIAESFGYINNIGNRNKNNKID
jgi:hypothetical protein